MSDLPVRKLLTSRDLLRFQMADDPQMSPDGTRVAWVRTWIEPQQNNYRSQISITNLESGETHPLTSGAGLETHPRWSPDGQSIAYLAPSAAPMLEATSVNPAASVVGKGQQLWVVPASGGQARQLTCLLGGVQEPAWSPDRARIAFITYVDPARGLQYLGHNGSDDLYERFNRDVLIARRMDWKMDGVGYVGDYRRMVAWVSVDGSSEETPAPLLLTRGDFDLASPAWSPDGTRIAAVGSGIEERPSRTRFVYMLDAVTPAEPVTLFGLEDIRNAMVGWSQDGTTLAVCGHNDANVGHYGNQQLWLVDALTGEGRCVTEHLDRTTGNAVWTDVGRYGGSEGPAWLPDGEHLLALVSDEGSVRLCRVAARTGEVTLLTPKEHIVAAFTVDEEGKRAVALVWEPLAPCTLYIVDLEGGGSGVMRLLVNPNTDLLGELELSKPEPFTFPSGEAMIEGWVIPPARRELGKQFPTILYHGGGPGGMRGPNFVFEFQLYAAQGYAVVYCNTRGVQGYGQDFCTAILGAWGGLDYEDNLRGLEVAIERYPFIDASRLATAGGSYGGYQVNWILGHDHRFRAAVSDRSVFNRHSTYGTSDIGFLREFEFDDGPPWETTEAYLRQSPAAFISGARTPTLVVHSARDLRCPIEQGEQLFASLKQLGVPTELVRFPNESHGLSRGGRPWHRVFRMDRYLQWFGRWV